MYVSYHTGRSGVLAVLLSEENASGNINGLDVHPGNVLCLARTTRPRFELEDRSAGRVYRKKTDTNTCGIHSIVHNPILE